MKKETKLPLERLVNAKTKLPGAGAATRASAGYRCWDCGSTIPNHHTKLCDLAEENAIRDLPAKKGTQYWTKAVKD